MGATIGTRFTIWRKGQFVGEDEFKNRYYQEKNGKRRWVIYHGEPDASAIPPDWHGWMHHTFEHPPVGEHALKQPEFGVEHRANPTGTAEAYHPPGSLLSGAVRRKAGGEYEAWSPDGD